MNLLKRSAMHSKKEKAMKKTNKLCIAALVSLAVELVFSLLLKAKSVPSSVVVGKEGTQSLVYFFPETAGIVFCILMIFTAVMINGAFKAYAQGSIPRRLAHTGVWLLNAAVSLQSVIKIKTMEMYSFENSILRIVLFITVIFSVLSCFIIKKFKIS